MSEEANATWHPAMMPNSAADLASNAAAHLPPVEEKRDADDTYVINDQETTEQSIIEDVERPATPPDNSQHPSLGDLRTALETSLASPGGVEMNDSPVHNVEETAGPETVGDLPSPIQQKKADFPTRGPGGEPGHASSDSFTRTVPDEINWGEDDEVDPEWNIHRRDTDPFKLMAKTDRTNSFPDVPPVHGQPSQPIEQPLAATQAEDIIEQIQTERQDPFDDDAEQEDSFFAQPTESADDYMDEAETGDSVAHQQPNEGDTAQDYGKTSGGDAQNEEEESSRYEEGIPLVAETQQWKDPNLETQNHGGAPFDEIPADDDFFAGIGQNKDNDGLSAPEKPSLDRKSTMQVMDAFNYPTNEPQDDEFPEAETLEDGPQADKPQADEPQRSETQEDEPSVQPASEENTNRKGSRSSFDKATGGGIAGSLSTVLSEVLGNPEGTSDAGNAENGDQHEVDLAERWKAALEADALLDDDELLDDDDELLPDDDAAENGVDPAAFFGSDDEGFLDDNEEADPIASLPQDSYNNSPMLAPVVDSNGRTVGFDTVNGKTTNGVSATSKYLPTLTGQSPLQQQGNAYTPSSFLTDLSQQSTPAATNIPVPPYGSPSIAQYNSQPPPQSLHAPGRPDMVKAQSFADKAKGGYSSPYDLPMEVVKPKKRASMQQMSRNYSSPTPPGFQPPPRSSSSYHPGPPSSSGSGLGISPSAAVSQPPTTRSPQPLAAPSQPQPALRSQSSFFEDLPVTAKPKPAGRYTPQPTQPAPSYGPPMSNVAAPSLPPSLPPQPSAPIPSQSFAPPPSKSMTPPLEAAGLVAPPRVNPYAALPPNNPVAPSVSNSRYSPGPAPTTGLGAPLPPTSRYSPAPPAQRPYMPGPQVTAPANVPAAGHTLAHQPRTSSPLAHFERNQAQRTNTAPPPRSASIASSDPRFSPELSYRPLPAAATREVDEYPSHGGQPVDGSGMAPSVVPPPPASLTAPTYLPQQRSASNYAPQLPTQVIAEQNMQVRRAQTESPSAGFTGPKLEMSSADPQRRPSSVLDPTSPIVPAFSQQPISAYAPAAPTSGHRRAFSQSINYVVPTDGREHDLLQRWKGYPIFNWGAGGTVVTSFPKEVPRYGITQTAPMIICNPGEVKTRSIKDVFPLKDQVSGFPGPLKGKSKKKEILAWLKTCIETLQRDVTYLGSSTSLSYNDKRQEERVLLWKILEIFVEHDGVLEGNAAAEKAVRGVLSPGIDSEGPGNEPTYATGADLSGIAASAVPKTQAEPVDPTAVDQLRQHLLRGEREKAVWEAVDKRLWAHAILISNTVSKDLYKQVIQEFVQKEVRTAGENTESLAALYEVFAGNFEESIDELVPPSARAGFQMVSTSASNAPSKSGVEGLDKWRETLGLILSNRSNDDEQALIALGKLLAGYDRAEAAHICFIFARSRSVFGGIDDPASNIVLLGSNIHKEPLTHDLEPILLSEVYEYGLSLHTSSVTANSVPHLAAYKLQHAIVLAEYGYRESAIQYCDSIASSITSQTRRSPYHHTLLISLLEDLNKRLKQSPKDESSSWISKPSIDKVSGSVWAKFNKFVAGDEDDAAATSVGGGGATESGPFARIAGDTPTISRSPSTTDLYGSYPAATGLTAPMPIAGTAGRYAPGGTYTPPSYDPQVSSSYGSQRRSLEQRPSGEYHRGSYGPARQSSEYRPVSQASSFTQSYAPVAQSETLPPTAQPPHSLGDEAVVGNASPYMPAPHPMTPVTDPYAPNTFDSPQSVNSYGRPASGYEPPASNLNQPSGGYEPPQSNPESQSFASYEPPTNSSYEPPANAGYEPPSYQPASFEEPDSPIDTKPKKKSFMDNDDDDIPAVSKAAEKSKAEKDREADEAFRKAAEEDGRSSRKLNSPQYLANELL
jgi:hypothetical protein